MGPMHPLLRTLEWAAPARTESSVHDLHPVRDAASARSHGYPLLLSLLLTPLLIYGLSISLISPTTARAVQGALDQARRSIPLLLEEPENPGVQASVPTPPGLVGSSGAGHREGTNTLDPRLVAHTSLLSRPSDAIDLDELSPSPKADRVFLSLNPALPHAAGGNGLARGTGRESAVGPGGQIPYAKVQDFRLIPIRQVMVTHQLTSGQDSAVKEPLRVRISINEDGIPTEATLISGPEFLREKALKVAMEWRFEPLGPHGLKAPLSLTLIFHPNLLRSR